MKRYILTICLITLNILGISAQNEVSDTLSAASDGIQESTDSLRASLITCTPGTDVYAHFGHTALRITNLTTGEDVVFNYGCFDMSGSNFVINFMKGETDYVVDAEPADYFFARYDYMGNGVSEQILNLTQPECYRLADLLFTNIRPENRGYRYNWLYDNCTTRARDMIEKAIQGNVNYLYEEDKITPRNELHECLSNNSWLKLGIDLLLGTEIDEIVPRKIQQFIPSHYKADLNSARIEYPIVVSVDSTTNIPTLERKARSLVIEETQILQEKDSNKTTDIFFTPNIAFSLLLIITIALSIYDYKRKKATIWYDALLHFAQGIAGIIIAGLFFFSIHPGVSTNWQVIIFNPLYILYAVYLIYCHAKNKKDRQINANTAVLCIFIIVTQIAKQDINASVWLMALTLCIRNLTRYHLIRKYKQ